jgi:hypothetical protein
MIDSSPLPCINCDSNLVVVADANYAACAHCGHKVRVYDGLSASQIIIEHRRGYALLTPRQLDIAEAYASANAAIDKRYGERVGQTLVDNETPIASCPASWWQHLKLTLLMRWPRVFGWLDVRWKR